MLVQDIYKHWLLLLLLLFEDKEWHSPHYRSHIHILEESDIRHMMRPRNDFAHKGSMGNALLIAGSYGMTGAAILATKACLRAGVGKVTTHTPKRNYDIMQISVPEAVLQLDHEEPYFSEPTDADTFDAVGIGPGLGINEGTAIALIAQIRRTACPQIGRASCRERV